MKTLYIGIFAVLFTFHTSVAQNNGTSLSFVSYNVENFFDTEDDPHTLDNEFLPNGIRKWNNYRFYKKRNLIFKTLLAIGKGKSPNIIALCEIENRYCLEQLTQFTPLRQFDYRIIHKESPDKRGIDVALIYQKKHFTPIDYWHYPVITKKKPKTFSRDILHVKGVIFEEDTIHIFVNHWPSRYRGLMESQPLRINTALQLKQVTDSILSRNENIILMGDFNDSPTDESMTILRESGFCNLSKNWKGTLKHQAYWNTFDQFLVSHKLKDKFRIKAKVIRLPFLLTKDLKHLGQKPFRTYVGFKYQGGISDHLPIEMTLNKNGTP